MAKRIALYAISTQAAKYKKAIIPLFSFNAEFYIRLLFIVKDSPEQCQTNIDKHGQILQCRSCQYRRTIKFGSYEDKSQKKAKFRLGNYEELPSKCPVCASSLVLCGPYWISDLHDKDFLIRVLKNLQSEEFKYLKYNARIQAIINGMLDVRL